MTSAPIALFVYNRPGFTRRTLEALAANEGAGDSELFIFADGPKPGATDKQLAAIRQVRELIREKQWCKKVTIVESPVNKGLAGSIIAGVTQVIQQSGKIIVIEDDVVTSPWFLRFMNDALEKYAHEEQVISIGSWNYYYHTPGADTYFVKMPDTIAWATWQRAWQYFEPDATKLMQVLRERNLMHQFNQDGLFDFEGMLQQQIDGKISSWAVRWTAVATLRNTLTLYPVRSLTKHIGFGTDSTHVRSEDYNEDLVLADSPIRIDDIPITENKEAVRAFVHFDQVERPARVLRKQPVKRLVKRILATLGWKR